MTKIFVGMMRSPWEQYANPGGYILCTCGSMLTHQQAGREHWQLGHFDTPVYKEAE